MVHLRVKRTMGRRLSVAKREARPGRLGEASSVTRHGRLVQVTASGIASASDTHWHRLGHDSDLTLKFTAESLPLPVALAVATCKLKKFKESICLCHSSSLRARITSS